MSKFVLSLCGGSLPSIARRLGRDAEPHEAVPGDRHGQVAMLGAFAPFAGLPLTDLTNGQVLLAAMLAAQYEVKQAMTKVVRHRDHEEAALLVHVPFKSASAVTVALLPCGIGTISHVGRRS